MGVYSWKGGGAGGCVGYGTVRAALRGGFWTVKKKQLKIKFFKKKTLKNKVRGNNAKKKGIIFHI